MGWVSFPAVATTQSADLIAEAWLRDRDIPHRAFTKWQLKVGNYKRVSYYPTKGTTFVDGEEGARTRAGLSGLAEVLIDSANYRPNTHRLCRSPLFRAAGGDPLCDKLCLSLRANGDRMFWHGSWSRLPARAT